MLQGPYAETIMKRVVVEAALANLRRFEHGLFSILDSDVMIARTSYSGEDGFEIFAKSQDAIQIWNYLISNGASPVGFDAIDIARIEAGLLFKKDSTNLWPEPKAQIVTQINFQHQDWVKPKTLAEICNQKLSSLSQNTTIYIGKQQPRTLGIIKNILKKNKSKKVYSSKFSITKVKNYYLYRDQKHKIPIHPKKIYSEGLINNLALSIKVALDFGVSRNNIIKTVPKIQFEGRVQYLAKGKLKKFLRPKEKLLIDGCHSVSSAKNLYDYLKTLKEPVYGIWGMQKNKLPVYFIKSFKNIFKKNRYGDYSW